MMSPPVPRPDVAQLQCLEGIPPKKDRSEAMNILYVTSSGRGEASYSNQVASRVIHELRTANPDATVTVRDLTVDALPHIDCDFAAATRGVGPQTERQHALLAQSDALIDEGLAADTIVIAAPMINFGVASTLKTWIDFIARPQRTFSYSAAGPKGLVTGKRVIVAVASGGVYSGDNAGMDSHVPWLRNVLGFLGMTDVEIIRVEGTALGPVAADMAVAGAVVRAQEVVGALAAA
jgi:FMN-dependent NADH-azoreductase